MLPTVPLDSNNNQIRIGDTVMFINEVKCRESGIVFKMTDEFVYMKCRWTDKVSKRRYRNVTIITQDEHQ